ncbi:MAG: hypothetical protein U1A77_23415 [Pirellulales bacterium]
MLKGLVIDNGIGAVDSFPSQPPWRMESVKTGPDFELRRRDCQLLIVPNGCDHVALWRVRHEIRQFLDDGGSLFCFCGWFTAWVPGNRWVHDNTHPTREARHFPRPDPRKLLDQVDLAPLDHNSHGISGWWACGYIETQDMNNALIVDAWGRPLVVADETTTRGFMFLTASGPLGEYTYGEDSRCLRVLYHNALRYAAARAACLVSGDTT